MLLAAFNTGEFLNRLEPDGVLLGALWTTLYISVLAQLIGTGLGVVSALGGMSRWWPLRALSGFYVWFIRGTPLVVQIFFWAFGANIVFEAQIVPRSVDLGFTEVSGLVLAGLIALSLNEGAYMSEIVRGGIIAIDPGQMEAARTVGMPRGQAMRRIVLPQAARVIVPGLGNEFNNMLKTSSLLSFIGVYELFDDARQAYARTYLPAETFLAVAIWYLLLTTAWALIQVQIERRLGQSDRAEDERWYTRLFGIRPAPGAFA